MTPAELEVKSRDIYDASLRWKIGVQQGAWLDAAADRHF